MEPHTPPSRIIRTSPKTFEVPQRKKQRENPELDRLHKKYVAAIVEHVEIRKAAQVATTNTSDIDSFSSIISLIQKQLVEWNIDRDDLDELIVSLDTEQMLIELYVDLDIKTDKLLITNIVVQSPDRDGFTWPNRNGEEDTMCVLP